MRKFYAAALLTVTFVMFLTFLLQGCAKTTKVASGPGFPMQITDDLGRQVTIKEAPQRIVSLAPAITETLFALGLGDKVVGVTNYCDYPAEAKTKAKVGGFSTPSAELVVAAKPDLVLAPKINENYVPQLEQAGLTVVTIESLNLPQVLENIRLIGQVTGASEAANSLTADMQQRIEEITTKVGGLTDEQKPAVYFEIWPDPLTTGGSKSFVNSLITMAGGKNIAGDVEQDWVNLSPEMVLARDPKVAILCHHGSSQQTVEEFKSRKGWEQVSAIKNNRVGLVSDENTVVRTGPRVVEGFEYMARLIHPELIK
ncbi:ABC transporter substrate-binding protein [Pelotomaculum propionicicum]|uniref:Vitamin B12-binding protein n=1 Tax=Pelotomaculum propionicicum TaxID=258475 RepID=A0A4Y7RQQ4_9FIRM|nr:ABC transporter substrate-binding protein [Pelotomaculum propionicicum]NLI13646.1 ABC transporter substrate-binding protein [Peptococcaceae bacterium]TEB11334.1 Vitamin B12-binding protein [Pelotomaculum propionicicum]